MWYFPIILIPTLLSECHAHPSRKLSTALWRLILSDTALCYPRAVVALRFKWFGLVHHTYCSGWHIQFVIRTNC